MARVQVGYDPRAEALQTTAAPDQHSIQARFDPRASSAFQLAEALGAPSVQRELSAMQEKQTKEEEVAGRAYAYSKPVSELRKEIESGARLPSQSPAYVAAVKHTYGENSLASFTNDTVSKMNRGELSFDTPEAAEKFLLEERNKILAGQDQFAIAGFDKRWPQVREAILDANNKALDKKFVEFGLQQASDAVNTEYGAAKAEGANSSQIAARLMGKYELLRATSVLATPAQQDQALKNIAAVIAADGNVDTLRQFLDSKLPNNGPSVRAKLGDLDAITLERSAEGVFDKKGREEADNGLAPFREAASSGTLDPEKFKQYWEPRQKYLGSATIQSLIDHNNAVVAAKARAVEKLSEKLNEERDQDLAIQAAQQAIANGRPVQDFVSPTTGKVFKAQEIGSVAMERFRTSDPNMNPQEYVRRYAQGGIKNPQWEREITTAVVNIGEVNLDAAGKPVGQLLPATVEALDKFAITRQVSEAYARDLAGSERNYETLTHIQALRENGVNDVNLAASLVNQKNRRNLPPSVWGNIQKTVNSEVESITNPSVFSGRYWGEVFRGEFGTGDKNLNVVKGAVKSLAETYLAAGVATDAKQAVEKAAQYYADPRITTQINNTVYLNKDLPELPEGMDKVEWFEKAMDGVVGAKLKAQGIKYNAGDITLIPQDGGNQPYMVAFGGIPSGVFVTKDELKTWITTEADKQNAADAERLNKAKKTRVKNPKITYAPDPNAPSIYASPEEWKKYRESQGRK